MFLAFRKKKLCGLRVLCGLYFFLAPGPGMASKLRIFYGFLKSKGEGPAHLDLGPFPW